MFIQHLELVSPSVHRIKDDSESHIDEIIKYQINLLKTHKPVTKALILEAAKQLPELNLTLYDNADCNENSYYMLSALLNFINDHMLSKYLFSALVVRTDGIRLASDFGLKKVWTDNNKQLPNEFDTPPTFFEGRLSGGI